MSNKIDEGHELTIYLAGNNKYIQYKTQKVHTYFNLCKHFI